MLIITLYADVTLSAENVYSVSYLERHPDVPGLNFGVALCAIIFIGAVFLSQQHSRKLVRRVHQMNLLGILSGLQQANQGDSQQLEGELEASASPWLFRRSFTASVATGSATADEENSGYVAELTDRRRRQLRQLHKITDRELTNLHFTFTKFGARLAVLHFHPLVGGERTRSRKQATHTQRERERVCVCVSGRGVYVTAVVCRP